MRARRFRPTLDCLDTRLVPSGTGTAAAVVASSPATSGSGGNVEVPDWYFPSCPPNDDPGYGGVTVPPPTN